MTDVALDRKELPSTGRPEQGSPGTATGIGSPRRRRFLNRRWQLAAGEIAVSSVVAVGFLALCLHISVNPLVRVGQVSGLAKVQLYAAVIGIPLLAVLLYSAYRGTLRQFEVAHRLACAALAGLATGIVAGGIAVALHGTPWGLGGQDGDPGHVEGMANDLIRFHRLPGVYPPGFPFAVAVDAKLFHGGVGGAGYALKDLQLLFSALVGPMSYLAWRLVLRPFWALLIAVPAAVVFLDPIRPYSHVVMIMLLPLLAACLRELRRAHTLPLRSLLRRGLGFGIVFGLMFLWYDGWYVWSAPGIVVLTLLLFPWRSGRRVVKRTLAFVGVVLASAGVVAAPLLYELVRLGGDTIDRYAYMATYLDPANLLYLPSDRVGNATFQSLAPTGGLSGQSGFVVLLLCAVGLGLGLGMRNVIVRTALAALASAWLMRFYFASHMAHDQAVQLYPRTAWIIFYCLMIMAVLGLKLLIQRSSRWLQRSIPATGPNAGLRIPVRTVKQATAGFMCALAIFAAMGASWSADRYMPSNARPETMGIDAWRSHSLQGPNGRCPRIATSTTCAPADKTRSQPSRNQPGAYQGLNCANITDKQWPSVCGHKKPY